MTDEYYMTMTVADLKKELECYDDDIEIVFEIDDDFEPEEVTEDKWGCKRVRLSNRVYPTFISECRGNMRIELGVKKEC